MRMAKGERSRQRQGRDASQSISLGEARGSSDHSTA
jgi:hypothetical protein